MIIFIAFVAMYTLWIFYLAVMNLMRARDAGTLTKTAKFLGMPIMYFGMLIDFIVNIFVMTVLFMELPREYMVTARLSRHLQDSSGYRLIVAQWFCHNLLDAFDPSGCHCKK